MQHIKANNFDFELLIEGPVNAPVVMLLHGFPETNFQWRYQIPALVQAGYRIIAPNLRGISPGARPHRESDYHIDDLTSDVLAIIDAMDITRLHLVGHDWGGILAWYAAAIKPEKFISLNIASTPHPAAFKDALLDPDSGQQKMSRYMHDFRQPDYATQMTINGGAGLKALYNLSGFETEATEHYLQYFSDQETLQLFLNWYCQLDLLEQPTIGPVSVPTLYVWSDGDIALGEVAAHNTRLFVNASYQFEILQGISHWLPEQAADQFNTLLLGHIKQYS